MRCFGPSASLKARLRRDELAEAFGEGYDEAEEARIFALEELARQQSELEEAFGEGYDPEEEARLFAEEDAEPPRHLSEKLEEGKSEGKSHTGRRPHVATRANRQKLDTSRMSRRRRARVRKRPRKRRATTTARR